MESIFPVAYRIHSFVICASRFGSRRQMIRKRSRETRARKAAVIRQRFIEPFALNRSASSKRESKTRKKRKKNEEGDYKRHSFIFRNTLKRSEDCLLIELV